MLIKFLYLKIPLGNNFIQSIIYKRVAKKEQGETTALSKYVWDNELQPTHSIQYEIPKARTAI